MYAGVRVCIPGWLGVSETLGCGCSAAAAAWKGASEGHTEVSTALSSSPAVPLWPSPLESHPLAAEVVLLLRSKGEASGLAAVK